MGVMWSWACQDQFALPEKADGKVGIFGVRFIYPVTACWPYGGVDWGDDKAPVLVAELAPAPALLAGLDSKAVRLAKRGTG